MHLKVQCGTVKEWLCPSNAFAECETESEGDPQDVVPISAKLALGRLFVLQRWTRKTK